ncbi:hypothetical protein [Coraliomargarita parva]|uniref:hypothetical protein n=1 Tax=Coraliomargarita parva TaxID=3014050 RepID=UPI0022B45A92|nr:hypothetical protein [Coraliomargarita parva]
MNDERFKELVNLYLDKEISAAELAELRAELESSCARKNEFEHSCRLHKAMLVALGAFDAAETHSAEGKVVSIRTWVAGAGMAACFIVGIGFMLAQVENALNAETPLETTSLTPSLAEDAIEPSDIRRYHVRNKSAVVPTSCLAAQLRLAGLRPEFTPEDRNLTSIDPEWMEVRRSERDRAVELFERMRAATPMPRPRLVNFPEPSTYESEVGSRWPGGFRTTLAGY